MSLLLSFLISEIILVSFFFFFFLAWLESLTLLYFFKEPTLVSLIFFYWFPDLIFIISFLLSTLDLVCSSFSSFLWRTHMIIFRSFFFATNFTRSTICVESPPNFDKLCFLHLVQNTIKFLLRLPLWPTYLEVCCVMLTFLDFPVIIPLQISSFTPLCSERRHGMPSVLLNVFRWVLWLRMWSVLTSTPCKLEKNVYSTAKNKLLIMQSPLLSKKQQPPLRSPCGLWVGKRGQVWGRQDCRNVGAYLRTELLQQPHSCALGACARRGDRSCLKAASPYWIPEPILSGSSSPEDQASL